MGLSELAPATNQARVLSGRAPQLREYQFAHEMPTSVTTLSTRSATCGSCITVNDQSASRSSAFPCSRRRQDGGVGDLIQPFPGENVEELRRALRRTVTSEIIPLKMLTMTEVAGLRRSDEDAAGRAAASSRFVSTSLPIHMGNAQRIAYGGCALALCVHAAYQTVSPEALERLRIYSVLGTYLGPTSLDAHVELDVVSLRDTKTFATRAVTASQTLLQKDPKTGTERATTRKCMFLVVDFIASLGANTLLTYSAQPLDLHRSTGISGPDMIPTRERALEDALARGELTDAHVAGFKEAFKASSDLTDQRVCPEGIMGQNLNGLLKDKQTTQEERSLTDKRSYDWFKTRSTLEHMRDVQTASSSLLLPPTKQAASAVFLSFMMDGALSFMPLSHSHLFMTDTQACSSLDLALRFHVDEFDAEDWHLRELFAVAGGDERTYSESRLFRRPSEAKALQLVATMTQSCVLRAKARHEQARL